jgi:hypothetical protein
MLAQPSESIQQAQESIEQSKKENCLRKDSISLNSAYFARNYYTNKQLANLNVEWLVLSMLAQPSESIQQTQESIEQSKKEDELYSCLRKDSISLNSAYFARNYYTNKQLANINVECLVVSRRILECLKSAGFVYYITWWGLWIVNVGAFCSFHELGHGSRYKSFGFDCIFGYLATDYEERDILLFYLNNMLGGWLGITNGQTPCCGLVYEDQQKWHNLSLNMDVRSFADVKIIISAGGLNNEMYLAERLADEMYLKKRYDSSIIYAFYLYERLSGSFYDYLYDRFLGYGDSSDPTAIIKAFKKKGRKDFKTGTIGKAGLLSMLLSGTTYFVLFDRPWCPAGLRFPDCFPYITTRGVSYKVISGYEVGECKYLTFGFETVPGKKNATEIFVGTNITDTDILPFTVQYKCIVTFGLGSDAEVSVILPLSPIFSMGLAYEYYHSNSLQGQRNTTSNTERTSTNISCFVSYRY